MELSLPLADEHLEMFVDGLDHSEGICATLDGVLYAGGEAGQLYRIEHDGTPTTILSTGTFLLGLAADAAGRIYAIDAEQQCVWRIVPASAERELFAAGPPERPFRMPNWGAFGPDGTYYLSDSGAWGEACGCIWRVPPGGAPEIWTEESKNFPNGIAVNQEGTRLYVAESFPGALAVIEIGPDGEPGARELLCDLDPAVPDGVALASDGSIFIPCYRPDAIYHWSEETGLRTFAEDQRGTILAAPTNIVFTGPARDQIVVPNLGRRHLTKMPAGVSGEKLHYPTLELLGE